MLYVESQHSLFDIGKIFLGDSFLTSTIASQCSGSKAQQLLVLESALHCKYEIFCILYYLLN